MDVEDLRLAVYQAFAETGCAPTHEVLSRRLDLDSTQIRDGLGLLHERRQLVIDSSGRILMAHPFSAVPLGFSVMGASTLWWGGCAWDSFALPHLLPAEREVLVATRCPGCRAALAWDVRRDRPPPGGELAHFLVPTDRMWDDVIHTCGHQRLFCGSQCIDAWLSRTGNQRGYVMDLETLWRLAAHWYDNRLERGYRRRDPQAAAEYFREVGLDGRFWGL